MDNRNEILSELEGLSPMLAGIEKRNVFSVPEGYFDSISERILALVNEPVATVISGISTQPVLEVPDGYFDGLATDILAKIRQQQDNEATEELRALSPGLLEIRDKQVWEVPAGYFEGLAADILQKQQQAAPAKVFTLRRITGTFMKYAVAAVFTGAMALGVFKFTGTGSTEKIDAVTAKGLEIAKENKFDEELAKVSDADIVKYLEDNNADVDAATLVNPEDDAELPAREDYLTDDKTLDKYLNSIDLNELKN